jgi:hypothetical protein
MMDEDEGKPPAPPEGKEPVATGGEEPGGRPGTVTVVPYTGPAPAEATKILNEQVWSPDQRASIAREAQGEQDAVDAASGLVHQFITDAGLSTASIKADPAQSNRLLLDMRRIVRSVRQEMELDGGEVSKLERMVRGRLPGETETSRYPRIVSARPALAQVEQRTGAQFLPAFTSIEEISTRGHQEIEVVEKKAYADVKLPKHGVATPSGAADAVRAWLYEGNPTTRNTLWQEVEKYGDEIVRFAKVWDALGQGDMANEVREAEWWQWKDVYDANADKLAKAQAAVLAADKAMLAAGDKPTNWVKLENDKAEALAAVKEYSAAIQKPIPPNSSLSRMMAGVAALRDGGVEGLREFIVGEKWGTRRAYYLSEPIDASDHTDELMELRPSHEPEPQSRDLSVKGSGPEGAAPRKGKGRPRSTQTIPAAMTRHWHKNWVYNRTREQFKTLQNSVRQASDNGVPLSRGDIKAINEHLWNATGRYVGDSEAMKVLTSAMTPANNAFWRLYFLDPQRLGWWMARQTVQQMAYSGVYMTPKTAARMVNTIAGALKKENKGWLPETAEATKDYPWRVSQRHEIAERMLREVEPQKLGDFQSRFELLTDWLAEVASMSDEAPRFLTYAHSFETGLIAARPYAKDHKLGKLRGELNLDGLPVTMSARLRLAAVGNDPVKFAKDYALVMADMVNFRYATSSRSAIEQTKGARSVVGLYTFARGTAELAYYQGLKQFYTGMFDGGGVAMALRGLMSMVGMLITSQLAYALLMASVGRGDYQLPGVLAWTPFSPGVSIIADMLERTAKAVQLMSTKPEPKLTETGEPVKPGKVRSDWRKKVATAWLNALLTPAQVAPLIGIPMSYYESRKGISGLTIGTMVAHMLKLTDEAYPTAKRNTYQSIMHTMFGGYEKGRPLTPAEKSRQHEIKLEKERERRYNRGE